MTNKKKLEKLAQQRVRPPAKREVVKPVSIYEDLPGDKPTNRQTDKSTNPQVVKYTTHLRSDSIKAIKRYAFDHEVDDYEVVQQAVDEFLKAYQAEVK